ncbi:hypothetical protein ACS0TY_033395 [Phlomoides rotata]
MGVSGTCGASTDGIGTVASRFPVRAKTGHEVSRGGRARPHDYLWSRESLYVLFVVKSKVRILCPISICTWTALTMAFGPYGSETLSLGPNTSMLLEPYHLFVESIKVVDVSAAKGLMLYGFYKSPPLDAIITWPETHNTALPFSTHKEWVYYLNEGSQINIFYSVTSLSSSSLVLVIAEGNFSSQNPKYLSIMNHLRFYLPEIFPKLDKVLFLDDDIVVQKDLTGLWSLDLKGKVIGVVETSG